MFQISSQIESISTRSDNTIKIVIGTQELPADQAVEVFKLKGVQGWTLFKENPITQDDIPVESAPEFKGDKSPSLRLRNTLYIFWDQNTDKKTPFDNYWKSFCEKKIAEIKERLN